MAKNKTKIIKFTQFSGTIRCQCGEKVFFDGEWIGLANITCPACGKRYVITTKVTEVKGAKPDGYS